MHPGAVVRVTKCAKKAMKVAKILKKRQSRSQKSRPEGLLSGPKVIRGETVAKRKAWGGFRVW